MVAALAGTAMSFSHSAEDQAESWLRALRMHGRAGATLQAMGIGDRPLTPEGEPQTFTPPLSPDSLDTLLEAAEEFATRRGADRVATTDLLLAILDAYDIVFDHALAEHGGSRAELIDRLEA